MVSGFNLQLKELKAEMVELNVKMEQNRETMLQHAQIQQRLSEMSSMWPQERYGSGWNANHSWSNVETEAGNGSAWNRSWAREAL